MATTTGAQAATPTGSQSSIISNGGGFLNQIGASFPSDPTGNLNSVSSASLIFPTDLLRGGSNTPYLTFGFYHYQRRSIFVQPFLQPQQNVTLPIPSQLVDRNAVDFTQADLKDNPAVGAAIEGYLSGGNSVSAAAQGAAVKLGSNLASVVAPPAQVLQLAGLAQNPFLTVLFNAPTFKRHTFSWRLAPQNETESQNLNDIIMQFRYHMLPDLASFGGSNVAGTLLTYPDIVQLAFGPLPVNKNYLYAFKPCVVEALEVNFAPGNTPGFFYNDMPAIVMLTMSLLEIEYFLKRDFVVSGASYAYNTGS